MECLILRGMTNFGNKLGIVSGVCFQGGGGHHQSFMCAGWVGIVSYVFQSGWVNVSFLVNMFLLQVFF